MADQSADEGALFSTTTTVLALAAGAVWAHMLFPALLTLNAFQASMLQLFAVGVLLLFLAMLGAIWMARRVTRSKWLAASVAAAAVTVVFSCCLVLGGLANGRSVSVIATEAVVLFAPPLFLLVTASALLGAALARSRVEALAHPALIAALVAGVAANVAAPNLAFRLAL